MSNNLDQLLQQSQQAQQRAQQQLQQSQLLLHQSRLQLQQAVQVLNPLVSSDQQSQLQQSLQELNRSIQQFSTQTHQTQRQPRPPRPQRQPRPQTQTQTQPQTQTHQPQPPRPQPQPEPEPLDENDIFQEIEKIEIETEIKIDPEQKGWDFISMDEISVKEYLEEDKNHIAVQIEKNANSIVLLDKTNIQNGFDDALRYECKEATGRVGYEFNNVYRDPPLFINLKQFGIFVGYGYASQIPIILADNTHQYYILKKWETKLVSVASKNYIDDYPNISSVSASHCQAGQDGDVYMWYKTNTNPTNDITNTTNDITNITNDIANTTNDITNTTNDITNTNTTNGGKKRKNRSIKTKRSKGGRKTKKVNK
jgi:hypothetical protein